MPKKSQKKEDRQFVSIMSFERPGTWTQSEHVPGSGMVQGAGTEKIKIEGATNILQRTFDLAGAVERLRSAWVEFEDGLKKFGSSVHHTDGFDSKAALSALWHACGPLINNMPSNRLETVPLDATKKGGRGRRKSTELRTRTVKQLQSKGLEFAAIQKTMREIGFSPEDTSRKAIEYSRASTRKATPKK